MCAVGSKNNSAIKTTVTENGATSLGDENSVATLKTFNRTRMRCIEPSLDFFRQEQRTSTGPIPQT